MSVYKTKEFSKFARKAKLASAELLEAAQAVAAGQLDADLGGGVFKQRIAREGGGKSGGFRTIILFKVGGHSFFVHACQEREGEHHAQGTQGAEEVGCGVPGFQRRSAGEGERRR
jgi:hypothetical protein